MHSGPLRVGFIGYSAIGQDVTHLLIERNVTIKIVIIVTKYHLSQQHVYVLNTGPSAREIILSPRLARQAARAWASFGIDTTPTQIGIKNGSLPGLKPFLEVPQIGQCFFCCSCKSVTACQSQ